MARPEDARWAAPAAWLAAALAFLSKGLIAVVLPCVWVIGLALSLSEAAPAARARFSRRSASSLAVAVAAPWFFAMQRRRPDFFHVFFYEQHFQRFLTAEVQPQRALVVLPRRASRRPAPLDRAVPRRASGAPCAAFGPDFRGPALAAWVLGVATFFSTCRLQTRDLRLPVFPHACLPRRRRGRRGPARLGVPTFQRVLGRLLLAAAALAAIGARRRPSARDRSAAHGLPRRLRAHARRSLAVLLSRRSRARCCSRRRRNVLPRAGGGGALAGDPVFSRSAPRGALVSAKDVGQVVRDEAVLGRVWTYGTYLHGLPFYAHRPVDKLVLFTASSATPSASRSSLRVSATMRRLRLCRAPGGGPSSCSIRRASAFRGNHRRRPQVDRVVARVRALVLAVVRPRTR